MNETGWQIFVEVPDRAPIELPLGEAVIGRSRASVVQIAETTVSRQHAVFVVEPGNVRLRDLGSSNGTYVNGKRVDGTQALADGDRVVVGEAELVIRILPPLGPGEATQKITIPPLAAPPELPNLPEPPPPRAPSPASPAITHAEPAASFRRTPTPLPDLPLTPPAPARAIAPAAALAHSADAAPASEVEAKASDELLPSIQAIDEVATPVPALQAPVAERIEPAGFWIRVAASLLDSIPFGVLIIVSFAGAFFLPDIVASLLWFIAPIYGALICLVLPALRGTTPGKKLLKLAIVSDNTKAGQGLGWNTALMRLVGHLVCSLTFGLGYLLVAFTAQKQGLHDLIAKTHVVRRG